MDHTKNETATWADQWDSNNSNSSYPVDVKPSGAAKYKQKVGEGLEKTKAAASTGAKKVKEGASSGFQWVKDKYRKSMQKR